MFSWGFSSVSGQRECGLRVSTPRAQDDQMVTSILPQTAVTMHGVLVLSSCYWCERHAEVRAWRAGGPLTQEALLPMRRELLCWLFGALLPTGLHVQPFLSHRLSKQVNHRMGANSAHKMFWDHRHDWFSTLVWIGSFVGVVCFGVVASA